jgi:hypothetical protein
MSEERTLKFWVPTQYYGGDIDVIAQAAHDCGVELVAVKGYPVDFYPGDREYVEGDATYLFSVELPCAIGEEEEKHEIAGNLVYTTVRMAVRRRYIEKYPEVKEKISDEEERDQ